MNINEVSELLKVNPETLRKWDKQLNLNITRNKKGFREYSEDDIQKLQLIKQLRDMDNGIQTINRKLNTGSIQPENTDTIKDNDNLPVSNLDLISKQLVSNLENRLSEILDLSEKYSRATFEIGKLQTENKFLMEKLQDKDNQIKLIDTSSAKDIDNLKKELDKRDIEINQKIKEIELLKEQIQHEKNIPWYKKIFN